MNMPIIGPLHERLKAGALGPPQLLRQNRRAVAAAHARRGVVGAGVVEQEAHAGGQVGGGQHLAQLALGPGLRAVQGWWVGGCGGQGGAVSRAAEQQSARAGCVRWRWHRALSSSQNTATLTWTSAKRSLRWEAERVDAGSVSNFMPAWAGGATAPCSSGQAAAAPAKRWRRARRPGGGGGEAELPPSEEEHLSCCSRLVLLVLILPALKAAAVEGTAIAIVLACQGMRRRSLRGITA